MASKRKGPGKTGITPEGKGPRIENKTSKTSKPPPPINNTGTREKVSTSKQKNINPQASYASSTTSSIDRRFSFATNIEGNRRDCITIEVLGLGRGQFNRPMDQKEAATKLWPHLKANGIPRRLLTGISTDLRGYPIISFRLNELVDPNDYFSNPWFEY